jgi:chromosome segregation ATPase
MQERADFESKCSSHNAEVEELRTNTATLEAKIKEYKEEANDAIMNYFQLEDKCTTLENDVARLTDENVTQSEECKNLEEKLNLAKTEIVESRNEIESLSRLSAVRDEEFASLQKATDEKDHTINQLESKVSSLHSQLESFLQASQEDATSLVDMEREGSASEERANDDLFAAKSEIERLRRLVDESREEIVDVAQQWKGTTSNMEHFLLFFSGLKL